MKIVKTFNSRIDAEIDRAKLDANSIKSFIKADDAGGAYPFPFRPSTSPVKLLVTDEDYEKSKEILESN